MIDLPAPLITLGIWPGATVRLTGKSAAECRWTNDDLAIANPAPDGHCDVGIIRPRSGVLFARRVPMSDVALVLPGEDGGNLYRLDQRIKTRTEGWADQGKMSDEFYRALGAAMIDGSNSAWLSRYLVMTDALAAKQGWQTGPGAPVYEWRSYPGAKCWLLSRDDGGSVTHGPVPQADVFVPETAGITDPMQALEAVWRRTAWPFSK